MFSPHRFRFVGYGRNRLKFNFDWTFYASLHPNGKSNIEAYYALYDVGRVLISRILECLSMKLHLSWFLVWIRGSAFISEIKALTINLISARVSIWGNYSICDTFNSRQVFISRTIKRQCWATGMSIIQNNFPRYDSTTSNSTCGS